MTIIATNTALPTCPYCGNEDATLCDEPNTAGVRVYCYCCAKEYVLARRTVFVSNKVWNQ